MDRVEAAFTKFDTDGNGYIDWEEFKEVILSFSYILQFLYFNNIMSSLMLSIRPLQLGLKLVNSQVIIENPDRELSSSGSAQALRLSQAHSGSLRILLRLTQALTQ